MQALDLAEWGHEICEKICEGFKSMADTDFPPCPLLHMNDCPEGTRLLQKANERA